MAIDARLDRAVLPLAALFLLATLPGCLTGIVFTHTVRPLTTDFRETPAALDSDGAESDVRAFEYYGIRVIWNTNSFGSIAKEAGFRELYYADLETLSILGIWTQQYVHLYGKR